MSLLINDIAQHLHNNGVGSLGVSLFTSYLPDEPDTAIVVYDTGGIAPEVDIPIRNITFQIEIRSTTYAAGRVLLDQVRGLFHQKINTTIASGTTFFFNIFAITDGGHLGRDGSGRDLFSINFRARIR